MCPKLKQIKLKNRHKQQDVKNVIFSDIECYMKADNKLPLQAAVDELNRSNSIVTGKELTLEFMGNDFRILKYCLNLFVKVNIKTSSTLY